MDLYQRTLHVSLHTGDVSGKSDLQSYLTKSNNAHLFLAVVTDETAEVSGRVLAITILSESMQRDKYFEWYKSACDVVHKMVLHKNSEIAATAAKYAKDEKILTTALDHTSPAHHRRAFQAHGARMGQTSRHTTVKHAGTRDQGMATVDYPPVAGSGALLTSTR